MAHVTATKRTVALLRCTMRKHLKASLLKTIFYDKVAKRTHLARLMPSVQDVTVSHHPACLWGYRSGTERKRRHEPAERFAGGAGMKRKLKRQELPESGIRERRQSAVF